ncbi:hypothetical protein ACFLQV_04230, partial [Calditrichota bacterium]
MNEDCMAQYGFFPPDSFTLNCTSQKFSWQHDPEHIGYDFLLLYGEDNSELYRTTVSTHALLLKDKLSFGESYVWMVRSIYPDYSTGEWSSEYRFNLIELPDSIAENIAATTYSEDLLQPDYTIGSFFGSAIGFDKDASICWFIPREYSGWFDGGNWDVRLMPSGYIQGISQYAARIFTVNDETIW